jgi:hypothetical protein
LAGADDIGLEAGENHDETIKTAIKTNNIFKEGNRRDGTKSKGRRIWLQKIFKGGF